MCLINIVRLNCYEAAAAEQTMKCKQTKEKSVLPSGPKGNCANHSILETTKLTILAYPRCVEVFVPTQEFFIFSFDWQSPLFQTKQERNKERLTSSHSHIFCSFSLNLTSHISSRSSWFLNHGGSGCIVDSQFCEVAMSLRTLLFHDLKVRFYYIIVFYSYLISNIK